MGVVDELYLASERGTVSFASWQNFANLACPTFLVHRGIVLAAGIHSTEKADDLLDRGVSDAQMWATVLLVSEILAAPDDDAARAIAEQIARSWRAHLRAQLPAANVRCVDGRPGRAPRCDPMPLRRL